MAIGRLKPLGAWLGRGLALAALVVGLAPGGGALVPALSARAQAPAAAAAAVTFPTLKLGAAIGGFDEPVEIANADDGSRRLFVNERKGRIRVVQNGNLLATPFLDIVSRVESGYGEQGLLGLAFPPGYGSSKNHFYVFYTASGTGDLTIARYQVSGDPNVADKTTEQVLLTIPHQDNKNHDGGELAFGKDGYLYIAAGDGGGGGDQPNNAQNLRILLGKLLRIDVESPPDQGLGYKIPPTNPFVGRTDARAEIWAYGLRNPWRFSFDRLTQDLYIGDVGQNLYEEIDVQPASSQGGENYGWRIMEGTHCYNASTCDKTGLTMPVLDYDHSLGCAVIGGNVYRGPDYASMLGFYFYGDACSGRIWALKFDGQAWQHKQLLQKQGFSPSSFGEDEAGRLYVADLGGTIYPLTDPNSGPPSQPPPQLPRRGGLAVVFG